MTHTRILEILNRNFNTEQKDHLQKLLEYNSTGGKNCRSAMFKTCLRYLQSDEQPEIACCIEYLQGAFLILDDIMDNGTTRRGKPCWHLVSKKTASKDGLYATRVIALLFRQLINDEDIYYNAIKFFSEVLTVSCIGQVHDALKRDIANWNDVERFYNRKNYEMICFGKNSYYTFYFPIKLAYILANRPEPKNLKDVCDLLGLCHQIRDDYLNFYPEKSKKDGLDIEERKLTWIICRIVENGYDEIVLKYLQRGDTEYMEREARKYLYFYDAEIVKINEKIDGLLTDDIKPIVDYCRNLLNKL